MVAPMDLLILIGQALIFIFPAYCANAVPVLAGGGSPMDFGRNFFDGRRIFGNNKTFRGFFFGWIVGILVGLVEVLIFGSIPYGTVFSILIPLGALCGDIAGAFLKRRLDIAPGGLLPIVDQVNFVIGALLFSLPLNIVTWQLAVTVIVITPPIHLFTNFLAFKLKLKSNPW